MSDERIHVDQKVGKIEAGGAATGLEAGTVQTPVAVQVAVEHNQGEVIGFKVENLVVQPVNADLIAAHNARQVLFNRVMQDWIKGVLERVQAEHAEFVGATDLLSIPKHWLPAAVTTQSDAVREVAYLDANRALPLSDSLVTLFQDSGNSLLLLGEPGSGKTVAMLRIAQHLLAEAEADLDRRPLPVILNLASWHYHFADFASWVVYELNTTKYGLAKATAYDWLRKNGFILLVDGLDEVEAAQRSGCVTAINHFLADYGTVGMESD